MPKNSEVGSSWTITLPPGGRNEHRTDLQAIVACGLFHWKRGAAPQNIGEMARPSRVQVLHDEDGGVTGHDQFPGRKALVTSPKLP